MSVFPIIATVNGIGVHEIEGTDMTVLMMIMEQRRGRFPTRLRTIYDIFSITVRGHVSAFLFLHTADWYDFCSGGRCVIGAIISHST